MQPGGEGSRGQLLVEGQAAPTHPHLPEHLALAFQPVDPHFHQDSCSWRLRVLSSDSTTPPASRPKVTASESRAGTLPMKPCRKILPPMKISTSARAYLR